MSGRGAGRGLRRRARVQPAECVCPSCGIKIPHVRGIPCLDTKCPKCGANMLPST